MDHPLIERTMRTGYPAPQSRVTNFSSKVVYREDPIEKMRRTKAKYQQNKKAPGHGRKGSF